MLTVSSHTRYATLYSDGTVAAWHRSYYTAERAAKAMFRKLARVEDVTCDVCGKVCKRGERLHAGHCDKCWNKS